ncbi:MAG: hypothetical protein ACOZBH_01700 [Patescibacteria group bacterium]
MLNILVIGYERKNAGRIGLWCQENLNSTNVAYVDERELRDQFDDHGVTLPAGADLVILAEFSRAHRFLTPLLLAVHAAAIRQHKKMLVITVNSKLTEAKPLRFRDGFWHLCLPPQALIWGERITDAVDEIFQVSAASVA